MDRQHRYYKSGILALLLVGLIALMVLSASHGEISVPFAEAVKALFGKSSDYYNRLVQNLRIPRIVSGAAIGASLSVSGLLTSTALKNPLADSGILGIQSGATVGALIAILVLPSLIGLLPLFAFLGGLAAFLLLMMISTATVGFRPSRVVLIGVAINAICTAVIGMITLLNVYKIRDAISWLNGSLAAISRSQMHIILWYTAICCVLAVVLIPILKILLLEDNHIINLGYKPRFLRILVSFCAVMLASIGVAFAGVITFVGIIAPQLGRRMVGQNFSFLLPASALIGGILVVGTDLFQRWLFAPMEIPVGILIGVLGAPLFIILAGRKV